jgi:endo-alpha-1,4-polygalactosaminidase (GH114 family)
MMRAVEYLSALCRGGNEMNRHSLAVLFFLVSCASAAFVPLAGCSSDGEADAAVVGGDTHNGTGDGGASDAAIPEAGTGADAARDGGGSAGYWYPTPGTSWQWQLSDTGKLDTSFDVQVYDVDMFETPAETIASLHAQGRKVVCYFDTAYEPGRPDSAQLEPYKHNPVEGWPGQYWLDVREPAVVAVMKSRIAQAKQKGCDGIEADDVDSRSNNPGTGITAVEQQTFIRTLAAESHAHGMAYALKSDMDDIEAVLDDVDFDINEECYEFNECDRLAPFIAAGKAVFNVEYTPGNLAEKGKTLCPDSNARNFDTLIKHLELDAPRYSCR